MSRLTSLVTSPTNNSASSGLPILKSPSAPTRSRHALLPTHPLEPSQQHIEWWSDTILFELSPMFAYDVLPTDGSIRLFVLEPGTGEQPLRGSLSTYKLDESPYFEAISYVWGSEHRCVELFCDGQQIFITASLSDVLHRVRLPDRVRTLWTDLICINQEDLDERGPQVSLMGNLYRRSNRTLIHVGEDDGGHGEPLQGFLNHIDQNIFAGLENKWNSAPKLDIDHPIAHDDRWKSLRHLLGTPWFQRGWVVQEAAYAHEGIVLWGDHELPWTVIIKTLIWLYRCSKSTIRWWIGLRIPEMHMSFFSVLRKDEVQPLMTEAFWRSTGKVLEVFHSGRFHQLADPRDRIYAFYNLPATNKSDKLQIIPNYHKSFTEVCKDFALNYMDVYDDLDLLLYVMHDEPSLQGGIPSWMPLWVLSDYPYSFYQSSWANQAPLIAKRDTKFSICDGSNSLLVSGLRFAKVQMVSAILTQELLTFERVASLWSEVCGFQEANISADSDRFSKFLVALRYQKSSKHLLRSKAQYLNEAAFALQIFNIATGQAKSSINPVPREDQAKGGDAQYIIKHVRRRTHNMRFLVTDRGYGMGPAIAREGDECVILRGGKMPFLLRQADGAGNYKLVGPIFHSSGQVYENVNTGWRMGAGLWYVKDWEDWDIEEEEFCLV